MKIFGLFALLFVSSIVYADPSPKVLVHCEEQTNAVNKVNTLDLTSTGTGYTLTMTAPDDNALSFGQLLGDITAVNQAYRMVISNLDSCITSKAVPTAFSCYSSTDHADYPMLVQFFDKDGKDLASYPVSGYVEARKISEDTAYGHDKFVQITFNLRNKATPVDFRSNRLDRQFFGRSACTAPNHQ